MSSSAGRRNSTHFTVQRQPDALVEFETFKRKYLGINKHITKLNSTLSVRIEALNAQLSELAVENLQLRAQNIQLNAQLSREREKTRRVVNDAEAAAAGLVARLGSLRDVYGVERGPPTPVSPPRKLTMALPRAPGASTPPPRIKVSRPPAFCALPEQDELSSFTDGPPVHGEREDIPPRPGSRCDMAPAGAGVAASTGPIRTSKSRTVRRQSGLIIDMLREDREQRDRDRDREQRDRTAQGIARLPTPTSSSAEEMDVSEVPAPPPGSTTDFDAFAALSTPERRRKARRLSGPVPSPPRQMQEEADEEAQVDYGLVLGRDSPLTEPEPEPEQDERERIEREREAILRAARKRQKEDRAREREERAREREQKEREREQKEREREQKERLRVEREKLRERKSAERLEQMEKEELAPAAAPVPVQVDAHPASHVVAKDAPRVPFEPVTNASGTLAPPTAPVKKRSIPSLVPPPSSAAPTTTTAAKSSRIPALSLVVDGDAARPQSPTDTMLVVPSVSLPVSRKPERLQVPVTLPPVERERSRERERASVERERERGRERERERASVERERTPPPQPESTTAPVAGPAVEDGRTRRVRSSVNYAEPKLNTKMRRPDPEEGGPAWPPTSRRKRSSAATTSAATTSSTRPRVASAEDAPREDGAPDDPLASRRHTIAV